MIKVCFPTGNEKRHIYKSMEADPPAGSKMKPTAVIKNCDIIKPGQNSVLANSSNKTNVVTRKKVFLFISFSHASTAWYISSGS